MPERLRAKGFVHMSRKELALKTLGERCLRVRGMSRENGVNVKHVLILDHC